MHVVSVDGGESGFEFKYIIAFLVQKQTTRQFLNSMRVCIRQGAAILKPVLRFREAK
jgi:hypothetical protein